MRGAVLTLDLGTRTGWARLTPDGVDHGYADFDCPSGRDGLRFQRFRAFLHDMKRRCDLAGHPLRLVVFEQVDFVSPVNGVKSIKVSFGLWGHLTAWCEHHSILYRGIAPGTLKKAMTGNGRAKKEEVRAAVRAAGYAVTDLNEADALALLLGTPEYRERAEQEAA